MCPYKQQTYSPLHLHNIKGKMTLFACEVLTHLQIGFILTDTLIILCCYYYVTVNLSVREIEPEII